MTPRALAIDALGNVEADMVERVTDALLATYGFVGPRTAERCAIAALEASHHAELVASLKALVTRVRLAIRAGQLDMSFGSQCLADADEILAKIGGEA